MRSAYAQDHHNHEAKAFSHDEHELAVLGLAITLGRAHVVSAQLAAPTGQATVERTCQRDARAAFLHAAARFLHQARVVLDPGAAVACLRPVARINEQAPLTEAMNVLAREAATLATHASGPMAAVIGSVQACVEAAASQLQEAG
jgi:hypothetical protein